MKPLAAILFCLVLFNCTPAEKNSYTELVAKNETDADFKTHYDNCLQIISLRQVDCKKVNCVSDYWDAVYAFQCLHALTGVESNIIVNSEDPYFYPTTDSKDFTEFFYEDLIHWNDWYENNKLTMTMAKADSLLKVHSQKVGYEVNWPRSYTQIFSSNPPPPAKGPEGVQQEPNSR